MEQKDVASFIEKLNSMTLKDRDLYSQYGILKTVERVVKERIEELSTLIQEEMTRMGEIKKEFDFGKFTLVEKKSYSYSLEVESKTGELKQLKKLEEENGTAQVEIKKYLLFK